MDSLQEIYIQGLPSGSPVRDGRISTFTHPLLTMDTWYGQYGADGQILGLAKVATDLKRASLHDTFDPPSGGSKVS